MMSAGNAGRTNSASHSSIIKGIAWYQVETARIITIESLVGILVHRVLLLFAHSGNFRLVVLVLGGIRNARIITGPSNSTCTQGSNSKSTNTHKFFICYDWSLGRRQYNYIHCTDGTHVETARIIIIESLVGVLVHRVLLLFAHSRNFRLVVLVWHGI